MCCFLHQLDEGEDRMYLHWPQRSFTLGIRKCIRGHRVSLLSGRRRPVFLTAMSDGENGLNGPSRSLYFTFSLDYFRNVLPIMKFLF